MIRFHLAVALAVALTGTAGADQLRVVGVSDGDTLTAIDAADRKVKIRLHGIDAPEKAQPFGTKARESLAELVAGKMVDVEEIDRDQYGRTVANVTIGTTLVNAEQVRRGMAWRYVQFDRRNEFGALEAGARAARRGLWADAHPVAPWEWRKGEKDRRAAAKAASR